MNGTEETNTGSYNEAEVPLNWEQRLSIIMAKRKWIAFAICCMVAAFATLPLFISGFPRGNDAIKHYRWSTEFATALKDGSLYPRWFPEANRGEGSPLPTYYPPVPFYISAAFNVFIGNMLTSISLSCWLALAISGLAMYSLSRLSLSRPLSLIAATFYMLLPYRILDLYLGSAISEFWSFAWVPLIFYFIYRVSERDGWFAIGGLALSYALLLQTHVPSAFLTSLTLPIFAVSLTRDYKRLFRVATGLMLGAGLSAIFVVPVLFERKYIHIGRVLLRRDYRNYFLFEKLGAAFKTILVPSEDIDYSLQTDLAAFGLLFLLIIAAALIWKKWRAGGKKRLNKLWFASLVITAFTLLMTARLTTLLYKKVPGLVFLLFPFRWLLVCSVGAAFLTAAAVSLVTNDAGRRKLYTVALAVVVIFNLTVSALAVARMPQDEENLERRRTRREAPEYHPIWWKGSQNKDLKKNPAVVDEGDAVVQVIDAKGVKQSYAVTANSQSQLRLRPLYFPGWVARVDDKPVPIWPSEDGNIALTIDPGEHRLTLSFEDTWPRRAGKLISAASVLCFLALMFIMRRTKRRLKIASKLPSKT